MDFERNLADLSVELTSKRVRLQGKGFLLIKKDVEKRSDKGIVECH